MAFELALSLSSVSKLVYKYNQVSISSTFLVCEDTSEVARKVCVKTCIQSNFSIKNDRSVKYCQRILKKRSDVYKTLSIL